MASQFARKLGRRLNVMSSIRGKINFILLSLMVAAGLAGAFIYQSFDGVSASVAEMAATDLPGLQRSADLITATSQTRDAMIAVMKAQEAEDLDMVSAQIETALSDLQNAISEMPEDKQIAFGPLLEQTSKTLRASEQARQSSFESTAQVAAMTTRMRDYLSNLEVSLLELADEASFDIAIQGASTIEVIDDTLKDLVDNKFSSLQALLEIRAEINLMSGAALALLSNEDVALTSILTDLAASSQSRLLTSIRTLNALNPDLSTGAELLAVTETLDTAMSRAAFSRAADLELVLSARQSADVILANAVDTMVFDLIIAAGDASENNSDRIQSLLDNEVNLLNTLLQANAELTALQVHAQKIATAPNLDQIRVGQEALLASSQNLARFRDFSDGRLTADIDGILEMADAQGGLAHFRSASLQASQLSIQAAVDTTQAVAEIATLASAIAQESKDAISGSASEIFAHATQVKSELFKMGWYALGFLVVICALSHFFIVRPLNRVSKTTERLSNGDMSPVVGFDRSSDEIARIANALTVFRDGIVDKEEVTRQAEAERAANQAEQAAAVNAVGRGLEHLSRGDLTYRIEDELTDGYQALKRNFNTAIENLNATVRDVIGVASSIRNGAEKMQTASTQLAERTQNQAATLEETAASIEQLTSIVKLTAAGAIDAASTSTDVHKETAESGEIVKRAVAAMKDIEGSSKKITDIVGVIDDVAFQTNLLALNAGVEAARAGEAGRGFAVVAAEVRNLAQNTTNAAKEIQALISNSSDQVDQGADLVGRTGVAIENILLRVSEISDLVGAIAEGNNEQATGLTEANISVGELDTVTQQNAAMVVETSSASDFLSNDANRLSQLMEGFNVIRSGAEASERFDQQTRDDRSFVAA